MGDHLNEASEFQSDKYPTCPPGKVPLSTKDPMAQDLLWEYAARRAHVDAGFSEDLRAALLAKGYVPESGGTPYAQYFYDVAHDEGAREAREQLTAAEAARDAAEKQLTALRAAATALVEALPKCTTCGSPAVFAHEPKHYGAVADYCDQHLGLRPFHGDVHYAAPLRALLALLPEAAPADGGGEKPAVLFTPEMVEVMTWVKFKSEGEAMLSVDGTWSVSDGLRTEWGLTREAAIRRAFELSRREDGK